MGSGKTPGSLGTIVLPGATGMGSRFPQGGLDLGPNRWVGLKLESLCQGLASRRPSNPAERPGGVGTDQGFGLAQESPGESRHGRCLPLIAGHDGRVA